MIRFLSSVGLLIGCMGLPLQAKGLNPVITQTQPVSAKSTKTVTKTTVCLGRTERVGKAKAPEKLSVSTASTSRQPTNSATKTVFATNRGNETFRGGRLARLTAYWAGEGDYYTGRCLSATGIRLHDGYCAVDPSIIPYGSVVEIAGLGKYLAVDTGSAVISRAAAREAAENAEERRALVIDLFFESRRDGERFAANGPKYAPITWQSPRSADNATKESIGLIAEESWNRVPSKQL